MKPSYKSRSFFAFDTQCQISAWDTGDAVDAINDCIAECMRYERLFSPSRADSELVRFNAAHGRLMQLDPELARLISISLDFCVASDGRFDITAGQLAYLWNYHRAQVPSKREIAEARAHTSWQALHVDGTTICCDDPQTHISLGGTAKGYIADRLVDRLREDGIKSAVVNLGGNMALLGTPAGQGSGALWDVSIASPIKAGSVAAHLRASEAAIVTSGDAERRFVTGGTSYGHIVDPRTGRPAMTDFASATAIVSGRRSMVGNATFADGWSTTLFMAGSAEALRIAEDTPGLEVLLICRNGRQLASSGLVPLDARQDTPSTRRAVPSWCLAVS